MKPDGRCTVSTVMNPHDIDDRDLTPSSPGDPGSLQNPDPTL